ncbi:MAG: hypothetical protein ABJR46_00520 [Tateyamaria sp.]|uniref:hypothetical protein n=1 Tax=Tateyamaria sp. TaxID=1929288 RepID=UPI00329DE4C3
MRFTQVIVAAATVTLISAVPSLAQQKVYPFKSSHNYCPTGLQPVTINGEVCCGVPTETMSYQHVMSHPVAVKKRHVRKVRHVRRADCPIGTKGCTFD